MRDVDALFMKILAQHPVEAAKSIVGCLIQHQECVARIIEVEAYSGSEDLGSHASRGPTPRSKTLFGSPGVAYVYLNYGMYWLFNITAAPKGTPGAVLIRAACPESGIDSMFRRRPKAKRLTELLSGPGKLSMAMGIGKAHHEMDLLNPQSPIQLHPRTETPAMLADVRIGLAKGKGDHLHWRFVDASAKEWLSVPLSAEAKATF